MKTFINFLKEEQCKLLEMAYGQLAVIERYANDIFKDVDVKINITGGHFFDRINDLRNGKPIEKDEVKELFKLMHDKYGKAMANMNVGDEFVVFDHFNNINIPFIVDKNHRLNTKTIMRKKNFLTRTKKFKV